MFLKKKFFALWALIVLGYQFCPLVGDHGAPDLGSTWLWSGIPWLRPVANFMLLSHFTQLHEHELTFLAHILYTENKKDFLWKHLFLNFFIYLPLLSKFSFCGECLTTRLYLHWLQKFSSNFFFHEILWLTSYSKRLINNNIHFKVITIKYDLACGNRRLYQNV